MTKKRAKRVTRRQAANQGAAPTPCPKCGRRKWKVSPEDVLSALVEIEAFEDFPALDEIRCPEWLEKFGGAVEFFVSGLDVRADPEILNWTGDKFRSLLKAHLEDLRADYERAHSGAESSDG